MVPVSAKWARALSALLGFLGVAACSPADLPGPDAVAGGSTYEASYLLIDALDSMTAEPPPTKAKPLSVPSYEINGDKRPVLYQHPASAYHFPDVPSGPGHRLAIAPAMHPQAWEAKTDGVRFEIECRVADGGAAELLALEISPATEPADRIWHDREVALEACSTPRTELVLRTTCGPRGNCGADWAVWGNPRVLYEQYLAPRPERLVLMISIDTLRPDHLSVYGYERDTSPQLARLAADSVVFETAVSTSPWTIPSHGAMLTSTSPRVHGATAQTPVSPSVSLVSEVLADAGWQTAGFVDTPYMSADRGFGRGFEYYDDVAPPPGNNRRGAEVVQQRILRWLADADGRAAFAFWHLMDVHGPYGAPSPFAGRFRGTVEPAPGDGRLADMRKLSYHGYLDLDRFDSFDDLVATYDEGIAFVDHVVGALLKTLRQAGLYDDALIVVTSDHGESFLDHGIWVGHGLFLTDDEIRVPLIVKLPGNAHAGTRVQDLVSQIDIAPTLLDALGLPAHGAFEGKSLLAYTDDSERPSPRVAFGFSNNTGASFVRTQSHKLVSGQDPEKLEKHLRYVDGAALPEQALARELLYDLARDPNEQSRVPDPDASAEAERLRQLIARHESETARAVAEATPARSLPELSEETRRRLRELGYAE